MYIYVYYLFSMMANLCPPANNWCNSQVWPNICAQGRKPITVRVVIISSPHLLFNPCILAIRFSWDNSTPLGLPVVPEVYMMVAISFSSGYFNSPGSSVFTRFIHLLYECMRLSWLSNDTTLSTLPTYMYLYVWMYIWMYIYICIMIPHSPPYPPICIYIYGCIYGCTYIYVL
jgi:hypothetical protein